MTTEMQTLFLSVTLIVGAYLLGSISFAVVVSKFMQLPDPHTYGSGNPGATNVLRTGNKKAAMLTLLGDATKGLLAVMLAKYWLQTSTQIDWALPCVIAAVFIGHLFPIFHGFKGGKGVATACGILFGVNLILGLATLSTWLIVAFFFRYSSLAALAAAAFAPFYAALLFGLQPLCTAILLIGVLLTWRHRQNIINLLNGKETKIGKKNKPK